MGKLTFVKTTKAAKHGVATKAQYFDPSLLKRQINMAISWITTAYTMAKRIRAMQIVRENNDGSVTLNLMEGSNFIGEINEVEPNQVAAAEREVKAWLEQMAKQYDAKAATQKDTTTKATVSVGSYVYDRPHGNYAKVNSIDGDQATVTTVGGNGPYMRIGTNYKVDISFLEPFRMSNPVYAKGTSVVIDPSDVVEWRLYNSLSDSDRSRLAGRITGDPEIVDRTWAYPVTFTYTDRNGRAGTTNELVREAEIRRGSKALAVGDPISAKVDAVRYDGEVIEVLPAVKGIGQQYRMRYSEPAGAVKTMLVGEKAIDDTTPDATLALGTAVTFRDHGREIEGKIASEPILTERGRKEYKVTSAKNQVLGQFEAAQLTVKAEADESAVLRYIRNLRSASAYGGYGWVKLPEDMISVAQEMADAGKLVQGRNGSIFGVNGEVEDDGKQTGKVIERGQKV